MSSKFVRTYLLDPDVLLLLFRRSAKGELHVFVTRWFPPSLLAVSFRSSSVAWHASQQQPGSSTRQAAVLVSPDAALEPSESAAFDGDPGAGAERSVNRFVVSLRAGGLRRLVSRITTLGVSADPVLSPDAARDGITPFGRRSAFSVGI